MDNKLRVLIVDDTVTYRKIVSTVLAALPDVEVLGTAANGRIALEKVAQTQPDLLLMDLEMPEMDGIEVLRRLNAAFPVGTIVLSALTAQGAQSTLDCLELGVFDFILKPASGSFDENVRRIREELKPRLAAYSRRRDAARVLAGASRRSATPAPGVTRVSAARSFACGTLQTRSRGYRRLDRRPQGTGRDVALPSRRSVRCRADRSAHAARVYEIACRRPGPAMPVAGVRGSGGGRGANGPRPDRAGRQANDGLPQRGPRRGARYRRSARE